MPWYAYILECADGTLYTGCTNDLERRVKEHNESALGAKYTHTRRPVMLKYSIECADRSAALKEEARIKNLTRAQKLLLLK
ncbi:MAG: Excinuclease subunit domain protein [Parcubacteria group bacterium]|nr:Excinuclease subunit domain protein [Parcubacteria group bacterium]